MLPSTNSSWSSNYGSNFPASNSLASFGERNHRMAMTANQLASHWGSQVHRPPQPPPPPRETGFIQPTVVDARYPSDGWTSTSAASSQSPRSSASFAVKDELTDPSDYSSEDTCSDYRDALTGSANHDYGDQEDRGRRTAADRRTDTDASMTAEEVEKRRIRRERNKMAAARCRQRRVDLTNQLLAETETLEDERDRLQREIQVLQRQRAQLEDLLGSHGPRCKHRGLINSHGSIDIPQIKTEKSDDDYFNMTETGLCMTACNSYSHPTTSFQSCSRPDSLPLTRRPAGTLTAAAAAAAVPGPANLATVANLGLDCMLDGHTGLTPITGAPPGPDHIVRSPVDCGVYSPTTLMTL